MAFVYQRAAEVLVWLGTREAPTSKDILLASSQWNDGVLGKVQVESWLYDLINQEYWKRTWIIQEICMANKIEVVSGYYDKGMVSWDDFVKVVEAYQAYNKLRGSTEFFGGSDGILKLDETRKSKYQGGKGYSLGVLLRTFQDSFSKVSRDKVYAFLGMANDHYLGYKGSIIVDYEKTTFEMYQDVVRFQNLSTFEPVKKKVEIMYLSSLVRRLLTRESDLRLKSWYDFSTISEIRNPKLEASACKNDAGPRFSKEE